MASSIRDQVAPLLKTLERSGSSDAMTARELIDSILWDSMYDEDPFDRTRHNPRGASGDGRSSRIGGFHERYI